MKKGRKRRIVKTYRNRKRTTVHTSFILLLFTLFTFLTLFHYISHVKPVVFKKAFATEEVASIVSPTRALIVSREDEVQEDVSVLSLLTFATSPTPSPVQTDLVQEVQTNDFCLDVPILMYHHVQPISEAQAAGHAQLTVDSLTFEEHLQYLIAQGFQFISSEDVVSALINQQPLPAKSIVITIDDGYDDAYNYAYPIAKKYNIPLDFMIPTGLLNNPGYMTWTQVKELSQDPQMHIFNHTWSHYALAGADAAKIEQEIMTANNQLEATIGKKINIFTYPYGSFGPEAIDFLQKKGFIAGISTIDGKVQCQSYIMTLHRTRIGNTYLSYYGF